MNQYTVLVVGIVVGGGLVGLYLLRSITQVWLNERAVARREAHEAQMALISAGHRDTAGIIADVQTGNQEALRAVIEATKAVVGVGEPKVSRADIEAAVRMAVGRDNPGVQVDEEQLFDDFEGAFPAGERELAGELAPGGLIPGIGLAVGGAMDRVNTAGEEYDG